MFYLERRKERSAHESCPRDPRQSRRPHRRLWLRLIEWLPKLGIETIQVRLSRAFPNVDSSVLENAVRAINGALQPGSVVLIDGLAFGVFTDAAACSLKVPIVARCHHPLGLEAGRAAKRSQALLCSEKAALVHAARVIVPSAYIARTLEQDFKVDPTRMCIARPGTDPALRAKGNGGRAYGSD
jgi:hypothetical protein